MLLLITTFCILSAVNAEDVSNTTKTVKPVEKKEVLTTQEKNIKTDKKPVTVTAKDIEKINVLEYENTFDLEDRLNNLKGNEKAKEFLRNQYKLIKTQEKREKLGKRSNITKYNNIIFTGDIGTGKKTVLNIFATKA